MRAIGYKEVLDYLDGQYDFDRMVELVKQHSRNYAKRQMTFLRGMQNIEFVDTEDKKKAFETILKTAKKWMEE
jgi:tRNA dimethylallyltransferase